MSLRWSPYLSVGVSSIDDLNIELFNTFNKLLDALTSGEGKEELADTVKFLKNRVVTQLTAEDKLMDRYPYPEAFIHKAEHSAFVADIASFSKQYAAAGVERPLAVDIVKRLGQWLQNHVGRTDQELGQSLRVAMRVRKAA